MIKISPYVYRKIVDAISFALREDDLLHFSFSANKLKLIVKRKKILLVSNLDIECNLSKTETVKASSLYQIIKHYRGGYMAFEDKKITFKKNEHSVSKNKDDIPNEIFFLSQRSVSYPKIKTKNSFTLKMEHVRNALCEVLLIDKTQELFEEDSIFDMVSDVEKQSLSLVSLGKEKAILYSIKTECKTNDAISIISNKKLINEVLQNNRYKNDMEIKIYFDNKYLVFVIDDDCYYFNAKPCKNNPYRIVNKIISDYSKNKIIISLNDLYKCFEKLKTITKERNIFMQNCYIDLKYKTEYLKCDVSGAIKERLGRINIYSSFVEMENENKRSYNSHIFSTFIPYLGEDVNIFFNSNNEPLIVYNPINENNQSYFILMPIIKE